MYRFVVAAAALALTSGVVPASSASVPPTETLVLQAAGRTASTSFVTDPGRLYSIRVSGVYTYNGTTGLGHADCGHKDPEDARGWVNVGNVLIDGKVGGCASDAFTPTHYYVWGQPGTGKPFRFEIFANSYTGDDTGCLLVTVSTVYAGTATVPVPPQAPRAKSPGTCWGLTH